jgi:hypothetical protein
MEREYSVEIQQNNTQDHGSGVNDIYVDLSGYWLGEYGSFGLELVQIEHRNSTVIATKITGDENVGSIHYIT